MCPQLLPWETRAFVGRGCRQRNLLGQKGTHFTSGVTAATLEAKADVNLSWIFKKFIILNLLASYDVGSYFQKELIIDKLKESQRG